MRTIWIMIFSRLFLILFPLPFMAAAFPIFPSHSAYINCKNTSGFMGDSSDVALGFAGGTKTNVLWDAAGSKLVLAAGQTSGQFISRVIDNSCIQLTPWLNFVWTTTIPFGKPLPATSESITDYPGLANSTLMSGLQGLWHLDENGYNGTANEIVDSSGNNLHGYLYSGTATTNGSGIFGKGLTGNGASYFRATTIPSISETATGSVWYKSTDTTTHWRGIIGRKRTNGSGYGWMIRQNDVGGVYIQIDTSAGTNQVDCYSTLNIMNGQWHHLTAVINNGNAILWIDGSKNQTCTYLRGTGFSSDAPIMLHSATNSTSDEIAFWSRALSDSEVQSLYQRGANRVKIQVRNCSDSTCSTNPTWRGPDNTATTFFTELNNNSNQAATTGTVLTTTPNISFSNFSSISLINRYLQYKVILETDNTSYRPDVKRIGPGR